MSEAAGFSGVAHFRQERVGSLRGAAYYTRNLSRARIPLRIVSDLGFHIPCSVSLKQQCMVSPCPCDLLLCVYRDHFYRGRVDGSLGGCRLKPCRTRCELRVHRILAGGLPGTPGTATQRSPRRSTPVSSRCKSVQGQQGRTSTCVRRRHRCQSSARHLDLRPARTFLRRSGSAPNRSPSPLRARVQPDPPTPWHPARRSQHTTERPRKGALDRSYHRPRTPSGYRGHHPTSEPPAALPCKHLCRYSLLSARIPTQAPAAQLRAPSSIRS